MWGGGRILKGEEVFFGKKSPDNWFSYGDKESKVINSPLPLETSPHTPFFPHSPLKRSSFLSLALPHTPTLISSHLLPRPTPQAFSPFRPYLLIALCIAALTVRGWEPTCTDEPSHDVITRAFRFVLSCVAIWIAMKRMTDRFSPWRACQSLPRRFPPEHRAARNSHERL